jgi:hypothetical protein
MTHRERFIWGLGGAFVSEMLHLYNHVYREHKTVDWVILAFVAVLILCGGICGAAWGERKVKNTFIVGITWPLLVAGLGKPAEPPPKEARTSVSWQWSQVVHAQTQQPESSPEIPGSKSARRAAAKSGNLPLPVLRSLASDPDADVREALASRKPIPAAIAIALAKDRDEEVREELAENDTTPESTLRSLTEDSDRSVRRAAFKTLERMGKLSIKQRLSSYLESL